MIFLNKHLSLKEFSDIVLNNLDFNIHNDAKSRVKECYEFLVEFSKDKIIYGVNTGFGPMAQYKIPDDERKQLQYNLIRSHTSGSGQPLPTSFIRAAMLARLNSLLKGNSGVHSEVTNLISELIDKEVYPVVLEHGGVGASGDLVQLAHIAAVLIGEGEVFYMNERKNTQEVFAELDIQPIKMHLREGLALMNGTSVMTGIGIINHQKAEVLLDWSVKCSVLINEIVESYDDHYSLELNQVKLHNGQLKVAEMMRNHLSDSKRTKKREQHLYSGNIDKEIFKEKIQEYYSIRCVPQILGPVLDTLKSVGGVLENELNSTNDNPIIDMEQKQVYHGGNFHGDYISLEMDKLKLVISKLTMLSERQLNFLLNTNINNILPPFVNRGKLGLNYGIQGAQFTATSTTAENQTLSNPMYVHSIPCNNDNQDIVSMGTNAALMTSKVIENAYEVISIEVIALIQAVRHLDIYDQLSKASQKMLDQFDDIVPDIIEDQILYPLIEKTKSQIKS